MYGQPVPGGPAVTATADRRAPAEAAAGGSRGHLAGRLRAAIAGFGAAALGAAPHVLHHVGPLAGAAIVAGATGRVLFGALGFILAIPFLRRLRTRHGSWRVPAIALAAMAVVFTVSTLVLGPALAGDGSALTREATPGPTPTAPAEEPAGHDEHH